MTLTEFLLARIAEDEAAARAATPGPWTADVDGVWSGDDPGNGIAHVSWEQEERSAADLSHIARHDPARVLAECEAKRGVIQAAWADQVQIEGEWGSSQSREQMSAQDDNPAALEWLALPYADHPDYREEWRP